MTSSTSGNSPTTGDRAPMDSAAVAASLRHPVPFGSRRWDIRHVLETGSTNDDLARGSVAAQSQGVAVLITEEQTAGRGRSGRHWACPPGAGLMFSVRLALPEIPSIRRGWIGAILGLAITRAFAEIAQVEARLKWPNDVLVNRGKCGGILAEMVGDYVVVGAGLNISLTTDELPRADATSLSLAGAHGVDRNLLLACILDHFGEFLGRWQSAAGDVDASGLRARYLLACATIGTSVRVELPGDRSVKGVAVDVDSDGAIVVRDGAGVLSRYTAGDVVHLRT